MKFSLRYKFVSIVLLSSIPFLIYAVYHYINTVNGNKKSAFARNLAVAEETSERINSFIENSRNVLYSLALHPAIINKDPSGCDDLFQQLLPLYPIHLNILAADMKGNNFASALSPEGAHSINYADREWFVKGSKGVSVVTDLHISKLFTQPAFMVTMPVFGQSGAQTAILGFPVNLYKFQEHLTEIEKIQPHISFSLVDNKGITLLNTADRGEIGKPFKQSALLQKASKVTGKSFITLDQNGTERYYSLSLVNATGWKVISSIPTSEVYAEADQAALRHLIFFFLICLSGGLSAIWFSRRLGRKVESIVNGLNEVSAGNYSCRLAIPGSDELAQAGKAFNRMTSERGSYLIEIKGLADSLERKVQIRTAELLNSKNELEAFSYAISHDLHAPVRHILAFTHILLEEHSKELSDDIRGHLERINRAGENMKEMITHLLALSRLNRHEITRVSVNVSTMSEAILSDLRDTEPGRNVQTTIAEGITTYADPALLRIVLQNLISNAWKYTRKCNLPTIEIGETMVNEIRCFFIKDNGCGFDMAYAEKLFAPFQRLHSTEEFEGSGIGLATVMRIVQRHGGRIWAESTPDEGAAFFFTIMSLDA